MSDPLIEPVVAAGPPRRPIPLAFVCVGTWVVAAVSAGPRGSWLGIWLAIGAASLTLGAATLSLDGAAARRLLRPTPRLLVFGALAGAAMIAATYPLHRGLARAAPAIARDTAQLYAAFRGPSPFVATLVLGPVILGEELVWRGVVQGALMRRLRTPASVLAAAAVFALAHGPIGSPYLVAVAFVCGATWGALRAATGSLVPSLVAHLLWDAVILLALPLDSR